MSGAARDQVSVRWGVPLVERAERAAMALSTKPPYVKVTFADVAKRGMIEYLDRLEAQHDLAPPKPRDPCAITLALGGVWFCAACGLRGHKSDADTVCPATGKKVDA